MQNKLQYVFEYFHPRVFIHIQLFIILQTYSAWVYFLFLSSMIFRYYKANIEK
jgi:hypothetical protein